MIKLPLSQHFCRATRVLWCLGMTLCYDFYTFRCCNTCIFSLTTCAVLPHMTYLFAAVVQYIIGGPRATAGHRKYSSIYWKNFTSAHSFKVSIFSQHVLRHKAALLFITHTLCMCSLDARFLHLFSCCWQDGGSPTFIEVDRWCMSSLFRGEQVVVHYTVLQKYEHTQLKQNLLRSVTLDIITRVFDNAAFVCIYVVERFSEDFSEVRGLRSRGFQLQIEWMTTILSAEL